MKHYPFFNLKSVLLGTGLCGVLAFSPLYADAAPQAALDPSQIQLNSLTLDQLQQAAQAGDPDAQYALGYMYYYGKNAPQNTQIALDWIKRAAVQGQSQAVKAMSLLGSPQAEPTTAQPAQSAPPPAAQPVMTPQDSADTTAPINNQVIAPETSKVTTLPVKTDKKVKSSAAGIPAANLASSQQLSTAPAHYFTIQLLASSNKEDVAHYTKQHHLQGKATYYRSTANGKDRYVLVYGIYKTRAEAQAALAKLPAELRVGNPWVKSVSSVQAAMKGEA